MAHKIAYYFTSNVGKRRKNNQDNYFCNGRMMYHRNPGTDGIYSDTVFSDEEPVFCVFDGMGGEECGEMAAFLAAETMRHFSFSDAPENSFLDFCNLVNRRICEKTVEMEISSMGTTAAMMRFTDRKISLCNIGDSKILLCSDGALTQISYDHVSPAPYGKKPLLTQNLGIPEEELVIDPYVAVGEHRVGDIYLICSDGLTDMVTMDRIQEILQHQDGQQASQMLLNEALENGGKDNVTFILLYVLPEKKSLFGEVRLCKKKK